MKQLRILTGRHAGTDLLLSPSMYRVGAEHDADILIMDWSGPSLLLTIEPTTADMSAATFSLADSDVTEPLLDFVPRTFTEIALCIGSADLALWPSDMQLMRSLLAAPAAAAASVDGTQRSRGVHGWWIWFATTAIVAIGSAFVLVVANASRSSLHALAPSLLARAQIAIERSKVTGVIARADGSGVVIEGLVPTASDEARLTAALDDLPRSRLQYRYASAANISQSISEALGAPGLHVTYIAGGDFLVEGQAVHADSLRPAAERIVNDLAPLVRSIRLSVVNLPPPEKSPVGAMLQTTGMEYVQTRDGTKHISLLSYPELEEQASRAGDSTPVKSLINKE